MTVQTPPDSWRLFAGWLPSLAPRRWQDRSSVRTFERSSKEFDRVSREPQGTWLEPVDLVDDEQLDERRQDMSVGVGVPVERAGHEPPAGTRSPQRSDPCPAAERCRAANPRLGGAAARRSATRLRCVPEQDLTGPASIVHGVRRRLPLRKPNYAQRTSAAVTYRRPSP
jgi:hypothetical protein